MKKAIFILTTILLLFILISCNHTGSISPGILTELDNAEKAMFSATGNGDSAAFRAICGTDYVTIDANGEAHNLEESLPGVPRFKGSTASLSEQKQRVYGDLVLRTGRAKFFMGAQQVAEVLYTGGWIYRDNRWQFIHWQGTMTGMMLEPLRGKVNVEPPSEKVGE